MERDVMPGSSYLHTPFRIILATILNFLNDILQKPAPGVARGQANIRMHRYPMHLTKVLVQINIRGTIIVNYLLYTLYLLVFTYIG
jgi:hypothetical protein